MTEALLRLDKPQIDPAEEAVLMEVNERLNRISQMIERIGNGQSLEIKKLEGEPVRSELTAGFLGMIRQAAKPGLKCE
jgi:hypothetical protein